MRLLRRNLIGTYSVFAVSIVSGLIVTPVVLHSIGTGAFGVWSFIGSLTIYLALLDIGVGPSLVRFGAAYRGRGAYEETNALASTALVIYGGIALLTIPLGLILAYLAPLLVGAPDELVWQTRIATATLVVGIVLRFPLGVFSNLLVAHQRWDVVNLAGSVSTALYAAAVFVLLPRTGGIVLLAVLTVATTFVRLALPMWWVPRELPGLRLSRSLVTRARVRELMAFSWQNFLLHLSGKVVFSSDVIVVGIVLGGVAAGYYALSAKLFAVGFGLASAGTNLLYPALSELEGAEELRRQRDLLRTGLRAGTAASLLLALPLVLVPDELLRAWVGREFVGESAPILALLGIVLVVHQQISFCSQFLIARGLQTRLALAVVGGVTANVVLSFGLAWVVGIWGVALATLVTDAILFAYMLPALVAPAAGIQLRELLKDMARPALVALVAALVVLVAAVEVVHPVSRPAVVALGVAWAVVAGAAIVRFGLTAAERASLLSMARLRPSAPVAALADDG